MNLKELVDLAPLFERVCALVGIKCSVLSSNKSHYQKLLSLFDKETPFEIADIMYVRNIHLSSKQYSQHIQITKKNKIKCDGTLIQVCMSLVISNPV
jgi:hypothetical protein